MSPRSEMYWLKECEFDTSLLVKFFDKELLDES
jgi:hypothetical protein